ncbi:MAG: transposase, partial [Syntrophobacterales bacterium]|nr:transposase [Syntrophobacterales bacterium]
INQETAYLITSLSPERADPEKLLSLNRGHWGIENKSHYVRDVTFDEDRSQVRTQSGPRVMATLRNLAINLLRLRGHKNIAQAIRSLVAKPYRVLSLIGA